MNRDAFDDADSETAGQVIERTDGEYRSLLVTVTLDTDDWTDRGEYLNSLEGSANTTADGGEHATTVAGSFAVSQSVLDASRGRLPSPGRSAMLWRANYHGRTTSKIF